MALKLSILSDPKLDRRLLLASGAFVIAAVPVTIIGYAATHGWGPLHNLDSAVTNSLHAWAIREPGAVGFLKGVSTVLDPWTLRAVAVGVVVFLGVRGQWLLARWAAVTVLVAGVLGFTLKLIVARSRPSLPDAVASAPGSSFPSGHALNSMAILGVLALLIVPTIARRWRPLIWGVAAAAVLLVGFARVALGVHYLSDVVSGWLIGAGLVGITVAAFETWRRDEPRPAGQVLDEGVDPAASRAAAGRGKRR